MEVKQTMKWGWSLYFILFAVVFAGCFYRPKTTPKETRTILRLHGPKGLSSELIIALAEKFLEKNGAQDVSNEADHDKVILQGIVPASVLKGSATTISIEIVFQDVSGAFGRLHTEKCDIVFASRKIEDKENQLLFSLGDMTALENEYVLALAGIAIVVHPENPLETLSIDQIKKIFTGKLKDWSDVIEEKTDPISVYALDEGTGPYEAFQQIVLADAPLTNRAKRISSDQDLLDRISGDPAGIGFVGQFNDAVLKIVPIADGESVPLLPHLFTISTEDYPLSHRLYLYLPDKSEELAQEFVDFALSQEGQDIVKQNQLVDLTIKVGPEERSQEEKTDDDYGRILQYGRRLLVNFYFQGVDYLEFDNKAKRDLNKVTDFLMDYGHRHKGFGIAVVGFTNKETQDANGMLSKKLVRDVIGELRSRGITNPIFPVGGGEESSVAINKSERGQARNRAEILVFEPESFEIVFDADRNSDDNRTAEGATHIRGRCDNQGKVDYNDGDKTDWYKVEIQRGGSLAYEVTQKEGGPLVVEFYVDYDNNQKGKKMVSWCVIKKGKGSCAYTERRAEPGTYYAKVYVNYPGESSRYKICK